MRSEIREKIGTFRRGLRAALMGPQTLAFLPALTLGAYWYGGEGLLMFAALLLPGLFALAGMFSGTGPAWAAPRDGETELPLEKAAVAALERNLAAARTSGMNTAAFVVLLDDFSTTQKQYGPRATSLLLRRAGERLAAALRDEDLVARLEGPAFAVILAPARRVDLEALLQIGARMQAALAEPVSVDATRVYLSASVGFCVPGRAPSPDGETVLECARAAAVTAAANGAGSIRAYSPEIRQMAAERSRISAELAEALELGQIRPWFQPQVSTDTGAITGFEALARWEHPEKGVILPADFLPAAAEQRLMKRLGEVMLYHSLSALRDWDNQQCGIPQVSINFSQDELADPKLVERLQWELDRFGLTADRLCVEILESVVANADNDVITRNIRSLSELGCRIDLDDFGTGHAAIASIRRFGVDRIKIDRSFITRLDKDREQQNTVTAILSMAERLNLDTLAEGVETVGEHAMLAQLGCRHVQGFSVARPMPFADSLPWIDSYRARLASPPQLDRKAG